MEPVFYHGTTYYNGKYIHDSDILRFVGINNYRMLNEKYPCYFEYFLECYNGENEYGIFPAIINTFIEGPANKIKRDVIMTICHEKYISENSKLVTNLEPIEFNVEEKVNTTYIWIFICIVIIILFSISIYVMFITPVIPKLFKINKI